MKKTLSVSCDTNAQKSTSDDTNEISEYCFRQAVGKQDIGNIFLSII